MSQPATKRFVVAKEEAIKMQESVLSLSIMKLDLALGDAPKSESSATGGVGSYGLTEEFEVLTADDIYWDRSVDRSVVERVAKELKELPEIKKWLGDAKKLNQNRRIEFRMMGSQSRPKMRVLFLCNNLPSGKIKKEAFMTNMWPN